MGSYVNTLYSDAYHLGFGNSNDIDPSSGPNYRRNGFPVRCLVYKFYFVRSGMIYLDSGGNFRGHGVAGDYWSNTAVAYGLGSWGANALYLDFSGMVYPSNGSNTRWFGLPVRCLVILC